MIARLTGLTAAYLFRWGPRCGTFMPAPAVRLPLGDKVVPDELDLTRPG